MLVGTFLHGTLKGSNEIDFLKLTRRSKNLFCHAKLFYTFHKYIYIKPFCRIMLKANHLFLKILNQGLIRFE